MKTISLAALLAALIAAPVLAQDAPTTPPVSPLLQTLDFAAADANSDGSVTPDEWTTYLAQVQAERFEQMTERRAEMQRMRGEMREMRGQMRAEMPGREGGRRGAAPTEEQRTQMLDRAFDRFDTDGDGQISRAEFDAAAAERMAMREDRAGRGDRDHGGRGHGGRH